MTIFSYIGLGSLWLATIAMLFLFGYFCKNQKKYNYIIELYLTQKHIFPGGYYFHSLMGYFGSFGLVYYFHHLKNKKEPLFMYYKNEAVYDFFEDIPSDISAWIDIYYRVTCFAFSCMFCMLFMALLQYIYDWLA